MSVTSGSSGSRSRVALGLAAAQGAMEELLKAVEWSLEGDELGAALVGMSRLRAMAEAVEMRCAVAADRQGVGDREGAASTADWWAHSCRLSRVEARRRMAVGP